MSIREMLHRNRNSGVPSSTWYPLADTVPGWDDLLPGQCGDAVGVPYRHADYPGASITVYAVPVRLPDSDDGPLRFTVKTMTEWVTANGVERTEIAETGITENSADGVEFALAHFVNGLFNGKTEGLAELPSGGNALAWNGQPFAAAA